MTQKTHAAQNEIRLSGVRPLYQARLATSVLTFELRRPERPAALPGYPRIDNSWWPGKAAGRGGSPLERGVRHQLLMARAGRRPLVARVPW
jgi:hypothetical protein